MIDDLSSFVKEIQRQVDAAPLQHRQELLVQKLRSIEDRKLRAELETLWPLARSVPAPAGTIVLLFHGIRTEGVWQDKAKQVLSKLNNCTVFPIKYGFFSAIGFWLPIPFRSRVVKKVVDELRDVRSRYSNHQVCVVAHSFGTYAISRVLLRHTDIQIYRLILCGSIIKRQFRWDRLARYPIGGVQNLCGTKDNWPILAYALSWGYGPSGTFGFGTSRVNDAFFESGHSDFFNADFIKRLWVPFFQDGIEIQSATERTSPPWWKSILGGMPILNIVLVFVIVYAAIIFKAEIIDYLIAILQGLRQ